MSASIVEEQPPAPSSWQKARTRFFGGSKRKSQINNGSGTARGTENPGHGVPTPYKVEDDDAQDGSEIGVGNKQEVGTVPAPAIAGPSSATATPVKAEEAKAPVPSGPLGTQEDVPSPSRVDGTAQQEQDDVVTGAVSDELPDVNDAADPDEEGEPASGVIEFLHKGAPYYWLSNHFSLPVYYDNIRYPSSEHLFQSLKFPHRPDIAKAVRKAETASDAVKIARRHAADCRKGWRQEGLNVVAMRQVLLLKFTQHSALGSRLLATGDADLVYSSPTDVFWGSGRGIGVTKPAIGRNELGKALAKTRDALQSSAGLGWGSGAKTV